MIPNNEIEIKVYSNLMTVGRYTVYATYHEPNKGLEISGEAYAQETPFHKLVGWGDSLETSLKKATCRAITDLNKNYELYKERVKEANRISDIVKNQRDKC